MSVFQVFPSIMSINTLLAKRSHVTKLTANEARKYTPPLVAGNVNSQQKVWIIGRGKELGAIVPCTTVVMLTWETLTNFFLKFFIAGPLRAFVDDSA